MVYCYIQYMVQQRLSDKLELYRRQCYSNNMMATHSAPRSWIRPGHLSIGLDLKKNRIADICRELGISRSSFRLHFQSLDVVLKVLWAR